MPSIEKYDFSCVLSSSYRFCLAIMHAVNQITPEVLLIMCIGGIAFILIMKAIFKKGR